MKKELEALSDEDILIRVFGNFTKGMSAYKVYYKLQKLGLDEYKINSCITVLHENIVTTQYTNLGGVGSSRKSDFTSLSDLYWANNYDPYYEPALPSLETIWHEPSKSYNEHYVYTKFRLNPDKVFRYAEINNKNVNNVIVKSRLHIFGNLKLLLTKLRTRESSLKMMDSRPGMYRERLYSSKIVYDGVEYSIGDLYVLRDTEHSHLCKKDETAIPLAELIPYSVLEKNDFYLDLDKDIVSKQKVSKLLPSKIK